TVGGEKREIIEILPDRRVKTVAEYFRNCDTVLVQTVDMDMCIAFKPAVQRSFSSPVIAADGIHFMSQRYTAIESVRREVQHTLTRSDRLVSKRSKKLLWLAPEMLDQKGKARVQELLKLHPDLAEAYRLKNALHEWFKTSDSSNVKENLYKWF